MEEGEGEDGGEHAQRENPNRRPPNRKISKFAVKTINLTS
jgi:hypothetical protein